VMKENRADTRVHRRGGRTIEIDGSFAPFHARRMLLSLKRASADDFARKRGGESGAR
jgi:hypothetical protein